MNWLEVSVYCSAQGMEPVSGALYSAGISALEIIDGIEDVKEFFSGAEKRWDYIDYAAIETQLGASCVRAYLADSDEGKKQLEDVREAVERLKALKLEDMGTLEIGVKNVADEDWANNWKQYFKPIELGRRVLILPDWLETPETDRVIYKMENCALFGTGQHVSTQFCATRLESVLKPGDKVLDVGAGSGILSIIALKLGAEHAAAVEIEVHSRQVIRENAELNGISPEKLDIIVGDAINDAAVQREMGQGYDVIMANIVADVIIALAPVVLPKLRAGGTFITSGIIDDRLPDVLAALEKAGFYDMEHELRDGWCVVTAKRG